MGIDSLPVLLGVDRAARVACLFMAHPASAGRGPAAAPGATRSMRDHRLPAARSGAPDDAACCAIRTRHAPLYNATGTTFYVLGMLTAACAVQLGLRMTAATLGWLGIVRLGLVQTALGAIVVLTTSTLNRVMVVELALPATLPGALVAMHYAVQVLRPRLGLRLGCLGAGHSLDHRRHGDPMHGRPARRAGDRLDDHEPVGGHRAGRPRLPDDRDRRRRSLAPRSSCCWRSAWWTSVARRRPPSSG